ncbi:MAG: DinB family protein [Chitinophagaceae bacterium]
MKKYKSVELLDALQEDVRQLVLEANYLNATDPGILLQVPATGKWSVIQVLEHLNSYGNYYLLAIERSLLLDRPAKEFFIPGWLGDYFTKMMKPRYNGTIANKMQTPKDHRPSGHPDAFPVLNTFLEQQHYMLGLLETAKCKNISSIKTPISISKLIRLKVGDTFRFLIAHEQRHFVQIENTISLVKKITNKYPTAHPVV